MVFSGHFDFWPSVRYNPDGILDMVVDKYEQYFKDHNRVKEFSGHSLKVHTVAWSADGKRLASGSLDKERLFIGSGIH